MSDHFVLKICRDRGKRGGGGGGDFPEMASAKVREDGMRKCFSAVQARLVPRGDRPAELVRRMVAGPTGEGLGRRGVAEYYARLSTVRRSGKGRATGSRQMVALSALGGSSAEPTDRPIQLARRCRGGDDRALARLIAAAR